MGADLYIEPAFETAMKPVLEQFGDAWYETDEGRAARAAVERDLYFRDSYNDTSVLWTLGLSWWKDVGEMVDDNSDLAGDALVRFRALVADAPQALPTDGDLAGKNVVIDDENTPESWRDYYRKKRDALLTFLDRAIAHGGRVHCSL